MSALIGVQIHITGIVQGVGFRPFVFKLAQQYELTGWVKNTSAGVDILVDGRVDRLVAFIADLKNRPPAIARIDSFQITDCPPNGFENFEIIHSAAIPGAFQPISPDVSICPDCLRELFDPNDRRYLYPFINCTNCGPRFTIIRDIPYDRPNTTMSGFPLCPDCAAEYSDPLNRRFHAQPVACPVCGPQIALEFNGHNAPGYQEKAALQRAQELLLAGKIIAIKGVGGFHLACDAGNPEAVAELRRRKLRVDKPFALMMADIEQIRRHCLLEPGEQVLIESTARPIILLNRRPDSSLSDQIAPGQNTLGVMLPYTPLHYLLFARLGAVEPAQALIMTSGNLSEEPIVTENSAAHERLTDLADAFLVHNRPIYTRCDDSVLRYFPAADTIYPIRRARGYAPFPVQLPWNAVPLLAAGAELKNTFCITHDNYAFLSHHIGDMQNFETLRSFEEGVQRFEQLFRVQPVAVAYDLHPDYLSTRYALERAGRENLPALGIQHHHAHIASAMAEYCLPGDQPVLGVAFDGAGYGDDGAIWGGEFLLATYAGYQRLAHLAYTPLPGGDAATRKPARIALAQLWQAGIDWDAELPCVAALCTEELHALRMQLERQINTPLTSSMGRLFDAVAALCGIRQQVSYEAQAAIELEALVDPAETGSYPIEVVPYEQTRENRRVTCLRINCQPIIQAIYHDIYAQFPVAQISARFHNCLAQLTREVCGQLRRETGAATVALSGGVWQNMTLLTKTYTGLRQDGFTVLTHRQVPANDGGLSLGQAAIAANYFRR